MVGSLRTLMSLQLQSACASRCGFASQQLAARLRAPAAVTVPQQQRSLSVTTPAAMFEADTRKVNIYTDYTIYKGRGAMSLKVIKPTWEKVATGSGIKIARDGVLLLEFAASRGEREYDWEGKETFALSATECADVLEAVETGTEKSFFHDPNKMGSDEGSLTKTLRLSPARESGWFFSLSVNRRGASGAKFDTIVSSAELRVIRTVMDFAIPRLLGFDEMFAGTPDIRESMPSVGGPMGGYGGGRGSSESDGPPF